MNRELLIKAADELSGVEQDRIPMSTPTSMSLSVLPKSEAQLKWNYWLANNAPGAAGENNGRTLRLANGPTSVMFKVPENFQGAATQMGDEDTLPEDAISGTAQIHRSSPDSIYFTMQDGKENRTVLLTKSDDGTWEAKVKPKKFSYKSSSDLKELIDWIPVQKRAFDDEISALADRPEYQATLDARRALQGSAGAPLRGIGNIMARSPAGSAALGGIVGGGIGAPAGALLSQLGYEKRVGPADNAVRLGALGSIIGALVAGGGSAAVRSSARQYLEGAPDA